MEKKLYNEPQINIEVINDVDIITVSKQGTGDGGASAFPELFD